ncbi:MAG: tRNA (adenosine(37)-N6)-dimethylallyltransferase MiaA [Deltaproteobacteria bacterium]|nr:tRNA (adenosine(37)-N6)-dimethylallyltransferase MiaA [Deltaproteobacteria bacterium]
MNRPKCIIIAGPTASGKTSISVALARVFDGEIVNADSMQVYRGMDIGTAKPTPEEQNGIPHHLLDVVDPDEEFNAAIYRSRALPVISDVVSRGKTCFVTGGTGLYIKSLAKGLFHCPPADMELRTALRRECESKGAQALHERLKHLDPESAGKIHPNDKARIIRNLEIADLTGRRPSDLIKEHGFSDTPLNTLTICLDVERQELYKRIDKRSVAMVDEGLAKETEHLLNKGYASDLKPMQSIGYRHMVNYLQGKWSLEEALHIIQRDTRRYAKRQLTWFKGDSDNVWIAPEEMERIQAKIREFL